MDNIQFYTNRLTLNTTDAKVLTVDFASTIHYANNALHGLGTASFTTGYDEYVDLSYRSFYAEVASTFSSRNAEIQIFEVTSGGYVNGAPIPALQPPGKA